MEIGRWISARLHGRRRHRRFCNNRARASIHIRTASAGRYGSNDEEPFALATALERRPNGKDCTNHRQDRDAVGTNSWRHRSTSPTNNRRSASRDHATVDSGATATFETNGRTASALDASRGAMAKQFAGADPGNIAAITFPVRVVLF